VSSGEAARHLFPYRGEIEGEGMNKRTSLELLQAANDRTFNALWVVGGEEGSFACECGRTECSEQVELTVIEYAAREGGLPLLAPGHAGGPGSVVSVNP
jgi:hypothetical protein